MCSVHRWETMSTPVLQRVVSTPRDTMMSLKRCHEYTRDAQYTGVSI